MLVAAQRPVATTVSQTDLSCGCEQALPVVHHVTVSIHSREHLYSLCARFDFWLYRGRRGGHTDNLGGAHRNRAEAWPDLTHITEPEVDHPSISQSLVSTLTRTVACKLFFLLCSDHVNKCYGHSNALAM